MIYTNNSARKPYLGGTAIAKAYVGEQLIYPIELQLIGEIDFPNFSYTNTMEDNGWSVTGLTSSAQYNKTYLGVPCMLIRTGTTASYVRWTRSYILNKNWTYFIKMRIAVTNWTGSSDTITATAGVRYTASQNYTIINSEDFDKWIDYEQEVVPTNNGLILEVSSPKTSNDTYMYVTKMEIYRKL